MDNDASSNSRTLKDLGSAIDRASRRSPRSGLLGEDASPKNGGRPGANERDQSQTNLALLIDVNASFEEMEQDLSGHLLTISRTRSRTLSARRAKELESSTGGRAAAVVEEAERPKKSEQNTNRQSRPGDGSLEPQNMDEEAEDQRSAGRSTNSGRSCQKNQLRPDRRAIQKQRRADMEAKNRDKKKADEARIGSLPTKIPTISGISRRKSPLGSARSNNEGKKVRQTTAKEKTKEEVETKDKDESSKPLRNATAAGEKPQRRGSKKRTGPGLCRRHSNALNLPEDGKLLIYYVSNLILCGGADPAYYDQAYGIIQQYGRRFWFESDLSGPCFKANLKKLEAIALYYQNKNVLEIGNLLEEAQRRFKDLNIYHGVAVCSYARAFFLYHKRFMFENPQGGGKQDDHKIISEASRACRTGLDYYERINHLGGQAESLKLLLAIDNVLNRTDPRLGNDKIVNSRWEHEITKRIRDIKREQTQAADVGGKHKFKFRTTHSELSLFIEVSFQQQRYAVRSSQESGIGAMLRACRPYGSFRSSETKQVPVEIKTDKLTASL